MENIELQKLVTEVHIDIMNAKTLVDRGLEVQCSRKLQGVLAKYSTLESILAKTLGFSNADVAPQSDEEVVSD